MSHHRLTPAVRHEADGPRVRHHLQDVADQQRPAPVRSGVPQEDRAAREMPAAVNQPDAGNEVVSSWYKRPRPGTPGG
jgi:hypothetical protein